MGNKDPAFLLYTADFLVGVAFMNYEQIGKYITLLCHQHQNGHLSEEDMLAVCGKKDRKIFGKFIKDDKGLYYNDRLEKEKKKRRAYAESRSKNGQKGGRPKNHMESICKPYENHTENEIEIDNEIILSSEVKKDNNIPLISKTNTISFSNTYNNGACAEAVLKNQLVRGSEGEALLFISDDQVEDLRNRLTEEEFDYYIRKMCLMIAKGYEFGCTHYDFILKMVDEDRRIRKDG